MGNFLIYIRWEFCWFYWRFAINGAKGYRWDFLVSVWMNHVNKMAKNKAFPGF